VSYDEQPPSPDWLQPNHPVSEQCGRCTTTCVDEASSQDTARYSSGDSRHLLQVRSLASQSTPAACSELVYKVTGVGSTAKPMFLGRRLATAIFLAVVLSPTIFSLYNQRNVPVIARQHQSIPLEQMLQGPTFFYK
jgi:hypothetical protein